MIMTKDKEVKFKKAALRKKKEISYEEKIYKMRYENLVESLKEISNEKGYCAEELDDSIVIAISREYLSDLSMSMDEDNLDTIVLFYDKDKRDADMKKIPKLEEMN